MKACFSRALPAMALFGITAFMAGCASNEPKPHFTRDIATDSRVSVSDTTQVTVDTVGKVEMTPQEKTRLAQKIQLKVDDRKVANAGGGAGKNYDVELHLSRYEKGNAFARAMLAGLGQIHIDGTVSVFAMPEHTLVGEFDLKKTFAWGGIYGAATSIETIEDTFADAVAAAVTGQQQQEPDKKKT